MFRSDAAGQRMQLIFGNKPIQIYWKFYNQKKWKFSDKNSDIFLISAQKHRLWVLVRTASPRRFKNRCVYSLEPSRRGGSNEYPQSMFLSRNKKSNVYHCKPHFYYTKVRFKGSTLYRHVFVMCCWMLLFFSGKQDFRYLLVTFFSFRALENLSDNRTKEDFCFGAIEDFLLNSDVDS